MCNLPVDNESSSPECLGFTTFPSLRSSKGLRQAETMPTSESSTEPLAHADTSPGPTLGPEDVREFAEIVKAETGVELPAQEAWDRAIELIALVRMLVRPDAEDPGIDPPGEVERRRS